jgi:hypothetical protein
MRPVESIRDLVSDGRAIAYGENDTQVLPAGSPTSKDLKVAQLRGAIRKYLKGTIDFTALFGMLVAEHWAISVEGQYYHLKKMDDGSLGLDLSPFAQKEEFLKIPLWKTSYTHEERAGIGKSGPFCLASVFSCTTTTAVKVLARMSRKKYEDIQVVNENGPVKQDGFVYRKFKKYVDLPRLTPGTQYNAAWNNCQHFGNRYLVQVFTPTPLGWLQWSKTAKEMIQLWISGIPNTKKLTADLWKQLKHKTITVSVILYLSILRGK